MDDASINQHPRSLAMDNAKARAALQKFGAIELRADITAGEYFEALGIKSNNQARLLKNTNLHVHLEVENSDADVQRLFKLGGKQMTAAEKHRWTTLKNAWRKKYQRMRERVWPPIIAKKAAEDSDSGDDSQAGSDVGDVPAGVKTAIHLNGLFILKLPIALDPAAECVMSLCGATDEIVELSCGHFLHITCGLRLPAARCPNCHEPIPSLSIDESRCIVTEFHERKRRFDELTVEFEAYKRVNWVSDELQSDANADGNPDTPRTGNDTPRTPRGSTIHG